MKRKWAVVAGILFVTAALAVEAQNRPKPRLEIVLTSDKTLCRMKDEIQLKAKRINAGSSSLVIARRWEWGISLIKVFDSKGKDLSNGVVYPVDDPPLLRSLDLVLLKPGESLGEQVDRSIWTLVKSPGDYEIAVEYKTYLTDDLARKYIRGTNAPFWSSKRGSVTSNRIKIRVTE